MKSIKQGKVVFDRNMKYIVGKTNRVIYSLDDVMSSDLYPIEHLDKDILDEFDENYRKNIDIWKIEIVIQTRV